jgi:hypothetical protein
MGNRIVTAVACGILGIAAVGSVALRAQPRQRAMYVSVLDGSGNPVMNVAPEDLVIREDGVRREILRVVPADDPMQIALMIDDSQASEPFISDYRRAFPAFASRVLEDSPSGGRHRIAIIGLASRPTIITEYTSDVGLLQKGVERIFAQSGTASYLLDGIVEVGRGLMRRQSSRPIMVAVITEGPEYSDRPYADVLTQFRTSGAALHAIMLGRPSNDDVDRGIVLQRGSEESGGQLDTLLASMGLTERLTKLAAELTHQYRVVYARPQSLIAPDRVSVSAARSGLTVRGMVAPETTAQDRQ